MQAFVGIRKDLIEHKEVAVALLAKIARCGTGPILGMAKDEVWVDPTVTTFGKDGGTGAVNAKARKTIQDAGPGGKNKLTSAFSLGKLKAGDASSASASRGGGAGPLEHEAFGCGFARMLTILNDVNVATDLNFFVELGRETIKPTIRGKSGNPESHAYQAVLLKDRSLAAAKRAREGRTRTRTRLDEK